MAVEQLHVPGIADDRVVLEGLQPGDSVIVEGTSKLRDGQKITVVGPDSKPASP